MSNFNEYVKNVFSGIAKSLGTDLYNVPSAIILFIICYILYKVITNFFQKFSKRLKLEPNIISILNTTIRFLIIFFSIMIIASALGINTSSLVAAFSVLGLAISLSVQNLMSNLANAISIYVNKPFKIGDYVLIGSVEGTVIEISFMLTKIKTYKNEIIYMPNTTIGNSIITNFSENPIRRIEHIIDASYDNKIDDVKKALLKAVNEEPLVLKNEEIYVAINSFSNSSIKYNVRIYTLKENYSTCKNNLLERFKKSFDENNITMPYDILDVNLKNN